MAKDPAFLFYPGDWLGGTLGMTFEEKGAYMELLMMQFTRGHMTEHMIGQCVGQLWVKLQDKFIKDNKGLWYNPRLDEEKEKRKNYVDSRKNNKNGTNQHTKKHPKKSGHMSSHMEDENVNENINEDKLIKASLKILTDFKFNQINHPNKLRSISDFIRGLMGSGRFEYFINQYPSYWEYKKISNSQLQSLDTFIAEGWDRENWIEKIKEYKNGTAKQTPDQQKADRHAVGDQLRDFAASNKS